MKKLYKLLLITLLMVSLTSYNAVESSKQKDSKLKESNKTTTMIPEEIEEDKKETGVNIIETTSTTNEGNAKIEENVITKSIEINENDGSTIGTNLSKGLRLERDYSCINITEDENIDIIDAAYEDDKKSTLVKIVINGKILLSIGHLRVDLSDEYVLVDILDNLSIWEDGDSYVAYLELGNEMYIIQGYQLTTYINFYS